LAAPTARSLSGAFDAARELSIPLAGAHRCYYGSVVIAAAGAGLVYVVAPVTETGRGVVLSLLLAAIGVELLSLLRRWSWLRADQLCLESSGAWRLMERQRCIARGADCFLRLLLDSFVVLELRPRPGRIVLPRVGAAREPLRRAVLQLRRQAT
jgi:hypothetical protein